MADSENSAGLVVQSLMRWFVVLSALVAGLVIGDLSVGAEQSRDITIFNYDARATNSRDLPAAKAVASGRIVSLPELSSVDFSSSSGIGVHLRQLADLSAPNGLPPLRQQYVDAVGGIDETVSAMRAAGSSAEDIARAAHAQRRAIGEQFKDLTPDPLRTQIFDRNVQRYGDPLGPSVDWLRDAGKSWDEIIESAARTGGQDLGF